MPKSIQQYPNTELSGSRCWTASSRRLLRGLPSYLAFSRIPVRVEAMPTRLPRHDCSARIAKNSPRLNKNPRRCSMVDGVFRFRDIKNCADKRYHQFHLTDAHRPKSPGLQTDTRFSRSLRYLVSQSFEQGKVTPIISVEEILTRSYRRSLTVRLGPALCNESQSVEHGFFDDKATMASVVALIKGKGSNASPLLMKTALRDEQSLEWKLVWH